MRKKEVKRWLREVLELWNLCACPHWVPHQWTGDSDFLDQRFLISATRGFSSRETAKCVFTSPLSLKHTRMNQVRNKGKKTNTISPNRFENYSFIHSYFIHSPNIYRVPLRSQHCPKCQEFLMGRKLSPENGEQQGLAPFPSNSKQVPI